MLRLCRATVPRRSLLQPADKLVIEVAYKEAAGHRLFDMI